MMQPRWTYYVEEGTPAVLVVEDLYSDEEPCPTVTNRAYEVLRDTKEQLGYMPPIAIYKDTEGVWDGLKLDGQGYFAGFYSLQGVTKVDRAINLARAFYKNGSFK